MQLLFKFKGPLLKPKPKIIFFNFYFESLNIHINHLSQLSMIIMASKWHHKNISNKITVLKEFQWLFDMVFGLFDCDCTLDNNLNVFWLKFNFIFMNFTQIKPHCKIPLEQIMPHERFPLINVVTL
jgi:hypothetical protein